MRRVQVAAIMDRKVCRSRYKYLVLWNEEDEPSWEPSSS